MIRFNIILHIHLNILFPFSSHNIDFNIFHARYMPNLPPNLLLDNTNITAYDVKYKSWIPSPRRVLHSAVTAAVLHLILDYSLYLCYETK